MAIRGVFDPKTTPTVVQRIHTLKRGIVAPWPCHKCFPKPRRVHKVNTLCTRRGFRTYTDGQCVLAYRGVSGNLARFT